MENQTEEPAPDAPVGDVPAPSVYAGLTVVELKEKLRERELPVSGTKDVLLARLAETEAAPATADKKSLDYSKLSRKELKLHRKAVNALAEKLRHKRDELNLKSQSHAAERDVLNAQAKTLMNQVYAHRDRRNGLNV
ncbi:MAG: SAP domain-containing protein, partial [Candidatus Thermoplasmatota archaeon]|nr:SAP domain-containing protein [Candidatus Thermoplasmatota archaeon]